MKRKVVNGIKKIGVIVYKETSLDFKDQLITFTGSFTGIAIIGILSNHYFSQSDSIFLIGSFGASCVLLFGHINSPLAQPRNVIGGHMIGAIVGVSFFKLFPENLWLSSALSVSLAIVLMQITRTLHPPAGATALIANIGSEKIKTLGFMYVLSPVLSGVLILLLIAVIINNVGSYRSYPSNKYWYMIWKRKY